MNFQTTVEYLVSRVCAEASMVLAFTRVLHADAKEYFRDAGPMPYLVAVIVLVITLSFVVEQYAERQYSAPVPYPTQEPLLPTPTTPKPVLVVHTLTSAPKPVPVPAVTVDRTVAGTFSQSHDFVSAIINAKKTLRRSLAMASGALNVGEEYMIDGTEVGVFQGVSQCTYTGTPYGEYTPVFHGDIRRPVYKAIKDMVNPECMTLVFSIPASKDKHKARIIRLEKMRTVVRYPLISGSPDLTRQFRTAIQVYLETQRACLNEFVVGKVYTVHHEYFTDGSGGHEEEGWFLGFRACDSVEEFWSNTLPSHWATTGGWNGDITLSFQSCAPNNQGRQVRFDIILSDFIPESDSHTPMRITRRIE